MILAIDPGNTQSGFVVLGSFGVIDSGIIPNMEMRNRIDRYFSNDILPPNPPHVAIEQIRNMGMIVGQEVFDTVFWTGRFFERCADGWNHRAQLVPRNAIKMHLCGSPRAKDANIRQALINRWGAPGTKKAPGGTYGVKSHAWSALAVATYALDNPDQEP